ncbi:hypothetical protein J2S49_000744 [Arcanobacterium wilhelmae]|uniref:Phage holin family protein n=1 Tax=Arcanobacterium wilhelmae TaxID=1803177 RepID=A0ABT9NAE9_9ACTO|nr:phage holin family protein [Arcanobacterium wilhelmae]MDP9800668.1 hypothetical protein [Arcanobacterium wilhelmae]WFN90070.1 phage holin family protein [Arcanobacterium wilhelmae]
MTTQNNPTPGSSIGELVAKITAQFSALVRDELKYATVQLQAKVTKLGVGGAILAVVGVLAFYLLTLLFGAAVAGFATIMPVWASFLTVAGILLLIMIILALVALAKIKSSKQNVVDPKAGLTKDVDAVKKGFTK